LERRSFDQDRLIRHNIDRFLQNEKSLSSRWERLFASSPLLVLTLAFMAGICLQGWLSPPVWTALAISVLSLVVLIASFCVSSPSFRAVILAFTASVMIFLAAGMLRYGSFAIPQADHISRLAGQARRLATLQGIIVSPVYHEDRSGWAFADYFPTPPQSSFYLSVRSIESPDGPQKATGLVRVQVAETTRHLREGDYVRLYCWLSPFDRAANPGQFDMRVYMYQRGVLLGASVPAAEGVEVLARRQHSVMTALRQRLKTYAGSALFEDTDFPSDSAALTTALLLGQRSDLDVKTYAAFQRTGLAHFISLSGMHVGILAGSLWWLSGFWGIQKPTQAILCLLLLLAYGMIVPPRAPTLRAIFLGCFFFSAVILNRRSRSLNTLALSALVLLMIHPADLFSASWQLSFSTVLGIIVLYDPIQLRLMSWTVFKAVELLPSRFIDKAAVQFVLKEIGSIVKLLSVGFSAWLGGAGFLLYHFHSITPMSSLWTVLTMPFVLMILYAGYLKIAFAPLFPTISLCFGVLMDAGCRCFSAIVMKLAHVPLSEILVGQVPAWIIAGGYAIVLLIRYARQQITRRILLFLVILAMAGGWKHIYTQQNTLTMTCLSVGHGQAICLSFPDKSHWLIDAGSISQKNPGGRTVLPYLRYCGIAALDAVMLTHGDMDHLNGVPEIISGMKTLRIYANAGVFQKAKTSSSASYFVQCLQKTGLSLESIDTFAAMPNGVGITMLWPDAETANSQTSSDNDKSQVLLIEYAGRRILLCGDIELYAQTKIREQYPTLTADVIVLPHHGSMTNLDAGFVTAFKPKIVIASCAAGRVQNAFVPKKESGIKAYYTPDDGAVTVNIKADGTLYATGYKSQKTIRLN
jgi:competence protein ComEC